jgi:putative hemolysin
LNDSGGGYSGIVFCCAKYVTPAAQYCAITGGTYTVTGNSNTPDETGTCAFKNGKTCDAGDYYDGKCSAKQ